MEKICPSIEKVQVVLIQCNLVDNKYQQKSEVLYTFTFSKCHACLLDMKRNNLVLLKSCNTEFDDILTHQNGGPFEIEAKGILTL